MDVCRHRMRAREAMNALGPASRADLEYPVQSLVRHLLGPEEEAEQLDPGQREEFLQLVVSRPDQLEEELVAEMVQEDLHVPDLADRAQAKEWAEQLVLLVLAALDLE